MSLVSNPENDVPKAVPGLGPMFRRLPVELLLIIFKLVVASDLPPNDEQNTGNVNSISPPDHGSVVDFVKFNGLLSLYLNDVSCVSKSFNKHIMQIFYESFTFKFTAVVGMNWLGNGLGHRLPSPRFRSSLRRVQIDVLLVDSYDKVPPFLVKNQAKVDNYCNRIANVQELFFHCSGARVLRHLTDATTGFSNLVNLELTLTPRAHFDNVGAVQLWQQAGFAVRAKNVDIKVDSPSQQTWPGIELVIATI